MSSRNLAELPPWATSLLQRAPVAHLGLADDRDHPRVLPITFAVAGGALYSAVDQKPKRSPAAKLARVRYLRRRPEAAVVVDRYDDDWRKLAWVQLLGPVEILAVEGQTEALRALADKYPPYHDHAPAGPLLRLAPARVLCWRASTR